MKSVLTSFEGATGACRRRCIVNLWRSDFAAGADGIYPGVGSSGKNVHHALFL